MLPLSDLPLPQTPRKQCSLCCVPYNLPPRAVASSGNQLASAFEPGKLPPSDESDLEEGGLGIEIIRALADEVEIGPRGDGGSRLRFVKLLADR